ncbi:MAG: hypothetical protein B7Y32_04300 [Methylophilales bacterium 16-45-7]|nr:MAG: hypothetical protein B7Y32_04300 [Methylophilales bacterium 16-45-7]
MRNFYFKPLVLLVSTLASFGVLNAQAGDRLLATGGVSQIEGAGGGGLTPWALIAGYGTDAQIGGSAFFTSAKTSDDFELNTGGVAVGFYNRVELSVSQTKFELGSTVPKASIRLNTLGVKLRLFGDAIYDQDSWVPQVAVGAMVKHNEDFNAVPSLIGAKRSTGVDYYLAASKLYLDALFGRNIILGSTLIATKANQFGLLGFGGDARDDYQIKPSYSAAIMLSDNLLLGMEYRYKPDNLSAFNENDAKDIFVTWFPHKRLSITAAAVDLGDVADKSNQNAWYLSGQLSY